MERLLKNSDIDMLYKEEYNYWLKNAIKDDMKETLKDMSETEIEDAFYKNLSFGTGGLRGIIGVGTNRMNVYTVAKASQGLANYLNKTYTQPAVVIGYDSREKSDVFAKSTAEVLAANGIKVYLWHDLLPVPTVSFAVRYLHASAGVMITASHNPAQYNGYKVYGEDGCQITTEVASLIYQEIELVNVFNDVRADKIEVALNTGVIEYVKKEVFDAYINAVKAQSVLYGEPIDKNVAIVYTPLNGTGLVPVTRILQETGYTNITIVKEQQNPDSCFTTCPSPNPEVREAMALGIEYAKRKNADLLLATDPDCDRVGIAVKDNDGEYQLLSGNETGVLLLDYICARRSEHNKIPSNPLLIKTIVTTDLAESIAKNYGLDTINVLTGFKFIGEQIGLLEEKGESERYVFGFEESYGCLSGTYVRDKDAVNGAYLICEMFSYYKANGMSLLDKLNEIYTKYGYCLNTLHSYMFEGSKGMQQMTNIMTNLRKNLMDGSMFAGMKIAKMIDYSKGEENLPKSDVLKLILEGENSVVIRPSGTEPKLKIYFSVIEKDRDAAVMVEKMLFHEIKSML